MKILITAITVIALVLLNTCLAEAQHIPDNNFAAAIREKCKDCIDSNNNLLPPAGKLDDLIAANKYINSIEGIQGFTSISWLDISDNNITALPELPASLLILNVSATGLTALPNLPQELSNLYCNETKNLKVLPKLNEKLKWLGLNNSAITSLPDLPASLISLDINHTNISELPSLPTGLIGLDCSFTPITTLPKLPDSLKQLVINGTQFTTLPKLPDHLGSLTINKSKIECITCANKALKVYDANLPNGKTLIMTPFCTEKPATDAGKPVQNPNGKLGKTLNASNGKKVQHPVPEKETASAKSIKDPILYQAIIKQCPECLDQNGNLLPPAAKLVQLHLSGGYNYEVIQNSTGLDGFINLKELTIQNLGFSNQTVFPRSLNILDCSEDKLEELPVLPKGLVKLNCRRNLLKTLPVLPSTLKELDVSDNLLTSCPAFPEGLTTLNIYNYSLNSLPHIPSSLRNLKVNTKYINCLPNVVNQLLVKSVLSDGVTEYSTRLKLCGTDQFASGTDKNYVKTTDRAPEKPVPKVYFFDSPYFWDDGKSVEEAADQPVNEFYRSAPGLTAVIYLPKGMHPDKYWDDVKLHYIFVVYADQYDSKEEKKVAAYTVIAEPRQRKIWKYLPLGDMDGQKFTVRVYEGDFTIYESVNPSGKLLGEGKVNRTQTR